MLCYWALVTPLSHTQVSAHSISQANKEPVGSGRPCIRSGLLRIGGGGCISILHNVSFCGGWIHLIANATSACSSRGRTAGRSNPPHRS